MKTVLVILDGAADEPSPLLCGKTPLHAAPTPHLDRMAATGAVGWLNPTPAGQAPGSEAGIPALNYGPGLTSQAHQQGEYCEIDALVASYEALWRFLSQPA